MRLRTVMATAAGIAGAAAGAGLAAMAFTYAWQVVRRANHPERPSRIVAFSGDTVTIRRYVEASRPGRFGMWFDDDRGFLQVGEVVGQTRASVTRRVERVEIGAPQPGMPCRLTGSWWRDPAAAGLTYEHVLVPSEVGPMPAWFIPPATATATPWRDTVILVHGWRSNRMEPLRAVPAVRRAGWSSLVVSYRNDVGAPDAPDGKFHLGATEWRDIESAVRHAIDRGAERIVLAGWSMGGGTVLQMLLRSPYAARIERVILDSPALEWHAILAAYVRAANYPRPIAPIAAALLEGSVTAPLVGLDAPIPLGDLSVRRYASRLSHPMLLIQGEDDPTTPVTLAREFEDLRPDIVEYAEFNGAGHVRAWNADPQRYETLIEQWLARD